MASARATGRRKLVVDPIHGDVHLSDLEWGVVDTASFQRLRDLKQLGMAHLTYPNATHTRFAHSIGAFAIMTRILATAQANSTTLPPDTVENLRLAALLHDIGHYPYSHLMERLDSVRLTEEQVDTAGPADRAIDAGRAKYPDHVEAGTLIVTGQEDLIDAIGSEQRARAVADLFSRSTAADPQLSKLIHSSFDMDRLDYLLRDSYAAGVPYGHIDINYLLNSLAVSPTGMLGVTEKAMPAAEQFLFARFFMHQVVYYHKTTYGMEEACRQLLRRVRDQGKYNVPRDGDGVKELLAGDRLRSFTDAFVDDVVRQAAHDEDPLVRLLAGAILNRRPPALLREVRVCVERNTPHHAGSTFMQNCRHRLPALADGGIRLGQFLLCETRPLGLEERGALLTAEEARRIPSEEAEEDVKVFVGDEKEPRSLVDVEHSLVSKCAGYFFQVFRLYVVYEGEDRDAVIARLRGAVRDWDRPQ